MADVVSSLAEVADLMTPSTCEYDDEVDDQETITAHLACPFGAVGYVHGSSAGPGGAAEVQEEEPDVWAACYPSMSLKDGGLPSVAHSAREIAVRTLQALIPSLCGTSAMREGALVRLLNIVVDALGQQQSHSPDGGGDMSGPPEAESKAASQRMQSAKHLAALLAQELKAHPLAVTASILASPFRDLAGLMRTLIGRVSVESRAAHSPLRGDQAAAGSEEDATQSKSSATGPAAGVEAAGSSSEADQEKLRLEDNDDGEDDEVDVAMDNEDDEDDDEKGEPSPSDEEGSDPFGGTAFQPTPQLKTRSSETSAIRVGPSTGPGEAATLQPLADDAPAGEPSVDSQPPPQEIPSRLMCYEYSCSPNGPSRDKTGRDLATPTVLDLGGSVTRPSSEGSHRGVSWKAGTPVNIVFSLQRPFHLQHAVIRYNGGSGSGNAAAPPASMQMR
eukprot:g6090.t1